MNIFSMFAPREGYEDRAGFHYGAAPRTSPPQPAPARNATEFEPVQSGWALGQVTEGSLHGAFILGAVVGMVLTVLVAAIIIASLCL